MFEQLEPRILATVTGATYQDGSEFMLGSVAVTVVLPESNNAIDVQTENFTQTQISTIKTQIPLGGQYWIDTLNKLQGGNIKQSLSFTYDFTYTDTPYPTSYEPIKHRYGDFSLWIDEFLNLRSTPGVGTFDRMDKFNDSQRQKYNTDWAFTIFVVNSAVDTDGKFSDGMFAYSYFGGPFLTMTTDNSNWGISRMQQVTAHEIGHIFYALDEYAGSGPAGYYTNKSGYYNTQNLNAADQRPAGSPPRVASIMAEASLQNTAYPNRISSPTSLQMVGWKDSDGDGVFDVLDVPLNLNGTISVADNTLSFVGNSSVGLLDSQNPYGGGRDTTLNTVDELQARINNGPWTTIATYGTPSVSINASFNNGSPITSVELRTIDLSTGVVSNSLTYGNVTELVIGPTNLRATSVIYNNITLAWNDNSNNETGFRIEQLTNNVWQTVVNLAANTYSYSLVASPSTSYTFRVAAVGNTTTSYSDNLVVVTPVTPSETTIPNAPTNLTISVTATKRFMLSWTDNSSIETGFRVEKSTNGGTSWGYVTNLGANTTSYTIGLTQYPVGTMFRIKAINGSYFSNPTNSVATYAVAAAPDIFSLAKLLKKIKIVDLIDDTYDGNVKIEN